MSDVAADALVVKGDILVEYAKPYGLNRNPNVNLASLGIIRSARAQNTTSRSIIAIYLPPKHSSAFHPD